MKYDVFISYSSNKTPSSKADSGSIFVSDSGSSDFVLKIKGVEYPMVFVEGGTFRMGSNDSDPVNYIKPHQVTLNDFTGKNFRLPTEAEWEFAARGGKKSQGFMYSGSNVIGKI